MVQRCDRGLRGETRVKTGLETGYVAVVLPAIVGLGEKIEKE
jgi:hypothetical protein